MEQADSVYEGGKRAYTPKRDNRNTQYENVINPDNLCKRNSELLEIDRKLHNPTISPRYGIGKDFRSDFADQKPVLQGMNDDKAEKKHDQTGIKLPPLKVESGFGKSSPFYPFQDKKRIPYEPC
jgi:hypothetical protein